MNQDNSASRPASYAHDAEYLVFHVAGQSFALPSHDLIKVIDSPECTTMPQMPPAVRGVINFMGEAVALFDLRTQLGLPTLQEEVESILTNLRDRKQDHIGWIGRLKDAVYNDKEITVQTDPHKCRFGLWYDVFTTDSITLRHYMDRFDKPHKEIHGLAIRAKELIGRGRSDEAKQMIHAAENTTLTKLLALFDGAQVQIRQFIYEYAVVIQHGDRKFAIAIDALRYFGTFDQVVHDLPVLAKLETRHFVEAIGRRRDDSGEEDVLILDIARLIQDAEKD